MLRGGGLREIADVGVAELLAHGGVGEQRGRRDHPADAQAGRKDFAHAGAVCEPGALVCGERRQICIDPRIERYQW